MCKLGDIIVVKEFKNEIGTIISRHSFVVVDDRENSIKGLNYDFVANMMGSFHNEKHRTEKLNYKQNILISKEQVNGKKLNQKDGYIKVNNFYLFNKKKIEYKTIGHLNKKTIKELLKTILELNKQNKTNLIITNL